MNTLIRLIQMKKQFIGLLFILITPLVTLAQTAKTPAEIAAEEAASNAKMALWGEIGIGVLFAGALTVFLIYKTKHDKKVREKQLEQMKKVMAAKKRTS